uniref:EB domain-containing protein n=1 Tax=Ascaris lumbricoides TaxID=6252 RepID=A0A0M3I7X5_ASCLU
MHKSYMCIDGYKPATVSMSNNEKLPLQAKTSCEKKQFCAPEQICMQRGKLGYCCDKGHPSEQSVVIGQTVAVKLWRFKECS